VDVEIYINRVVKGKDIKIGDLRIRKNKDEMPKEGVNKRIVTLNEEEIRLNAAKSYKEKVNIRREQEKRMEIKEKKPEEREPRSTEGKGRNPRQGRIDTDDEEGINNNPEENPTIIDIIRKDEDRGFKRGNKPKGMNTRYQERKSEEELSREELKGNAASIYLSHNMNKDKRWNDPQIKKEVWRTAKLTNYILSNEDSTWQQINKWKDKDPARAMKTIKRVLMQMHQRTRDNYTDDENKVIDLKGKLCIEALKLEIPIGNVKTIKQIMRSIEETYIRSNEYLILKAEILIRTREWREATMTINGIGKNNELMQEDWIKRINVAQGEINENEQKERRNRLISYGNIISKNLFENDEEINNATKLMWNRDYQEAIDAACKIWTKIMIINKPEIIFAKTKVLQIMIESTLNITMSDTTYAEE
jgi:hypothetical protein